MNWVITGGCGFIGRSLIARLMQEGGQRVKVLDNLLVGTREDLASVVEFIEVAPSENWNFAEVALCVGDILDRDTVTGVLQGADIVVHLAANTGVGPSVEDPYGDCQTNILGTLNVLEGARANVGQRVVFASSGAPLGVQAPPLHEELAPRPASPYGASKLAGEGYCSAYHQCFGVETVVLRFGNVYGPRSGRKSSVVAKFIKQAMAGEALEIYGNGRQTRDFIYISDLIDAVYKSATLLGIEGETFQIATSRETTIHELTEAMVKALVAAGIDEPAVFFGDQRAGDVARNYSDTSKASMLLDWQAETDLERGLGFTIKSFLQN